VGTLCRLASMVPEVSRLTVTSQMLRLLRVLVDDPLTPRYGLELSREAGLKSGTIYPSLTRLETARWVESEWEDIDPSVAGRPRRRLYRLTAAGEQAARAALDHERAMLSPRPSPPGALRPLPALRPST